MRDRHNPLGPAVGWTALVVTALAAAVLLAWGSLGAASEAPGEVASPGADAGDTREAQQSLDSGLLADIADAWARGMAPGAPPEYRRHVVDAAATCPGLPAHVLAAQIEVESTWDASAVSYAGAQGLAQFLPSTWQMFGADADGDGAADPFDPVDAIHTAARYDCDLLRRTEEVPGEPLANMLAAYHAGPGAVVAAAGLPPIPATQAYVARVLSTALGNSLAPISPAAP